MPLDNLIQRMQFDLAVALMATFIADERDNQISLAKASGYSDIQIVELIDFKIFTNLWTPPDASDLPAISIWYESGVYPAERQYPDGNWHQARINIDLLSVGLNKVGINGLADTTAEQNSDNRLQYLISQIYHILNAEQAWYKGASEIIKSSTIKGCQRIDAPEGENEAEIILGAQWTYELELKEKTETISGTELEILCSKLNIRDEFINPLVLIDLT